MFAQVHCPSVLAADELDQYLELGWFRMGQTLFTTSFLNFNKQLYNAVWLRVGLEGLHADKAQTRLFRTNEGFRVEFQPASIDDRKESLYAAYKNAVSFEPSSSLRQLLFRDSQHNIFNTFEVCVYDRDELIACGFFDIGHCSAAGIISFYNPAYRKFSLGKYVIYLKMHYCRNLGLHYFYPGYFVPGYFSFDYKLAIGRPTLEFRDVALQQWLPVDSFRIEQAPLDVMHARLAGVQTAITAAGIGAEILRYEYFDANSIPELIGAELFDFPVFLYLGSGDRSIHPMIVFDVLDQKYHLVQCRSVWTSTTAENRNGFYSTDLLKTEAEFYATTSAEAMAKMVSSQTRFEMRGI